MPVLTDNTEIMASTAPAAPSIWPVIDFVELTAISPILSPNAFFYSLRLGGIVRRRAGAVGVDVNFAGGEPASANASLMALALLSASGSGAVIWCASHVVP